jgi:tRNA pseudouridine38-40 synthase
MGVNTQLPNDISLSWAQQVDPEFHARFGALSRQYVYLIQVSSFRSALMRNSLTFTHKNLDPQLMADAGQCLVGTHDFNAYRSAQCQAKTSVRTLSRLSVHYHDGLIAVHVEANGFLQNMVRNIVGVLSAIGAQEEPVSWAKQVLDSKDRTEGGVTAPPHGLYFLGPTYDASFDLPETVRIPQIARDILRTDPLECGA